MKNFLLFIFSLLILVSCENSTATNNIATNKEKPNTVSLFLADVQSILSDTNKNPIVTFSKLAKDISEKNIRLKKNNIASALEEAKEYSNGVIVVENHTIVKLISFDDCQKSGSWGVCMPKGEGFIKKGNLNYKSDYINNIIGTPNSKKVTLFLFNEQTSQLESEGNQEDDYLNSLKNLKVSLKELDDQKYIDYLVSEYQKTENELENYDVYQLFDQGLLPIEKVKMDDEESFSYYFMDKSEKVFISDSTALYPPYCKTLVYLDNYQTVKKVEVIETDELYEWGRSKSYYCNKESLNFPIIYNYNFSDFYGYSNDYLFFKGSGKNISLLNASEEEIENAMEADFFSIIDITKSESTIKDVFSIYVKINNAQFIDEDYEFKNELAELSKKLKSDSKNKLNVRQVVEFNNAARELSLPFYMKFTSNQAYPYNNIIYKRLTPIGDWDFFRLLHFDWFSNKPIDGKPITNQMYIDFVLYDNISDAKADVNAWKFCNYDDPGVGFPRDCGKQKAVGGKWISYYPGLNSRTKKDFIWRLATNVDEIGALVLKILYDEYEKIAKSAVEEGLAAEAAYQMEQDEENNRHTLAELAAVEVDKIISQTALSQYKIDSDISKYPIGPFFKKAILETGEGDFTGYEILDSLTKKRDAFLHVSEDSLINHIEIFSPKYKIIEGIGVNSTYGELIDAYPNIETHGSEIEARVYSSVGNINFRLDVESTYYDIENDNDLVLKPSTKIISVVIFRKMEEERCGL
ncbi:MAG: hypothetical protein ISQ99_06960 [Flavobacteriales bacterium]|nr:hypothetical protein [Flavobacteriales bacterium]